ncbi:hypothetical protein M8C21_005246, partial [Ambrosia artemisiifolia]
MMLPHINDDDDNHDDEEMEIFEEAEQVILAAIEACKNMESDTTNADDQEILTHSLENKTCDQDCLGEPNETSSPKNLVDGDTPNLTILPYEGTPVLKPPTLSVTPPAINNSRKSLRNSSTFTSSPETNRLAASLMNGLE